MILLDTGAKGAIRGVPKAWTGKPASSDTAQIQTPIVAIRMTLIYRACLRADIPQMGERFLRRQLTIPQSLSHSFTSNSQFDTLTLQVPL